MEKQEIKKFEVVKENREESNGKQEWQKPELFLLDIENDTLNNPGSGGDTVGRS